MNLEAQQFAQRIIDEDGALIVAFVCEYQKGDVIKDITVPMRVGPGRVEIGTVSGLVVVGTATREEYLSQSQRFGTGTGEIPDAFQHFYKTLAE